MGDAWNFFGIKAQSDEPFIVVRTREVVEGNDVFINAKFRRFASMEECFREHGRFLRDNPRYAPAFKTTDAESFARAIHAAGYATDPHYSDALIGIIRDNDLTQYDTDAGSRTLAAVTKPKPKRKPKPKLRKMYALQQPMLNGPIVKAIQKGARQCRVQAGADRRGVRQEHGRRRAALSESTWPHGGRRRRPRYCRPSQGQPQALLAVPATTSKAASVSSPADRMRATRVCRDAVRDARRGVARTEGGPSFRVDFDELYDALDRPGAPRGRV